MTHCIRRGLEADCRREREIREIEREGGGLFGHPPGKFSWVYGNHVIDDVTKCPDLFCL